MTQHITHISFPEHLTKGFNKCCCFKKEYWDGDVAYGVPEPKEGDYRSGQGERKGGRKGGRGNGGGGERQEEAGKEEKEEEGVEKEEIPVPGRKRQGITKFEASLGCVMSSKQSQIHREIFLEKIVSC